MAREKQREFVFKSREVLRCIHHALCAHQWTCWSEMKHNKPEHHYNSAVLILVEDYSGVYLISGAQPRDRRRNKKIYSAYAHGKDNNVLDQLRAGEKTAVLCEMNNHCAYRNSVLAVIYLSVGENGHCYEEILAEAYAQFVVKIQPAQKEDVYVTFSGLDKNAGAYVASLDINRDETDTNTTGKRRLLKTEVTNAT